MTKKKRKSMVGWYVYDEECPVIYWEKSEWLEPFQKCEELSTNIFSQKKMVERVREKGERIRKVRITITEL